MGLLQLARVGFLAAFAKAQALPCSFGTSVFTVATSEDAATLASSLRCLYGDFAVQWIGEVMVAETIRVADGTWLNITGDGEGATADGGSRRSCSSWKGALGCTSRTCNSPMATQHPVGQYL